MIAAAAGTPMRLRILCARADSEAASELAAKGFGKVMMGSNQGFSFFKGPYDLTDDDRRDLYAETEEMLDQGGLDDIRAGRRKPYSPFLESLELLRKDRDRKGPQTKISCGVGRNDQGIDVDGGVYPCHRYVGMSAYKIGDIWSGVDRASVAAYYERVFAVYKHCSGCWATRWCGGGCPQYLSDPTGKVYGPDAPMCDSVRRALERNLGLAEMTDKSPQPPARGPSTPVENDGQAVPGT
ncbi:MAG: hypothetical protein HMLKMBBP_01466 [Planctomycetes bacterium]|nr:hypothetical protein [Planctomycetota bacterium]